jgi:N-acetyl-gamma-glutamyl-phosphate reductase
MMKKINVGIVGGSGFTGGELCRLLLKHKNIQKIYPTSRSEQSFKRTHSGLANSNLEFIDVDTLILKKKIDVVFLCTKSSQSIEYAEIFLKKKITVIDLSGAFRFNNSKNYFKAYGSEHSKKKLLESSAYGATEFNNKAIKKNSLIANPGCYALCALFSLAPLTKSKFADFGKIIKIHAINGTTGAGTSLRQEITHKNVMENMLAYNGSGHRHAPEIEEKLLSFFNIKNASIDLNTAHGNFRRGIFMQISIETKKNYNKKISRKFLIKEFKNFYKSKILNNFIFINDLEKTGDKNFKDYKIYPQLSNVVGTNNCNIGLDYDEDKKIIKVISVMDNLIKGAAGSAIQNMNLKFDFNPTEGLDTLGIF